MGEHHRAERGGDQQGAGDLEGEDVLGEEDVGERRDVAVGVGGVEARPRRRGDLAEAEHEDRAEQEAADGAATRWPLIVSTTESEASTPTSISTNRNSIRIAPV